MGLRPAAGGAAAEPAGGGAPACPAPPDLPPGRAQLWRLSLAVGDGRLAALAATLADDERARAAALRAPLARARFAAGRGLLRETLAGYTGVAPAALRLRAGPHGKPALDGEPGDGLRFNLAHCDDLLLIAVARGHELGVDVERARPIMGMAQIAASLLGAEERAVLEGAAPEAQPLLFATIWTRHEAIAKGEGGGLAHAPAARRDWSVFELDPGGGYVAALALEGQGWRAGDERRAGEPGAPWASFERLRAG